jgi:hypothetical protein
MFDMGQRDKSVCLHHDIGWDPCQKEGRGGIVHTIGMPHVDEELHGWRGQGVVLGELELGGEDAALKGRLLGSLDEAFPMEEVVL